MDNRKCLSDKSKEKKHGLPVFIPPHQNIENPNLQYAISTSSGPLVYDFLILFFN